MRFYSTFCLAHNLVHGGLNFGPCGRFETQPLSVMPNVEQRTALSDNQHNGGNRAVTEDHGSEEGGAVLPLCVVGGNHDPSHESGQVTVPRVLDRG
jgi:hypothetical protein